MPPYISVAVAHNPQFQWKSNPTSCPPFFHSPCTLFCCFRPFSTSIFFQFNTRRTQNEHNIKVTPETASVTFGFRTGPGIKTVPRGQTSSGKILETVPAQLMPWSVFQIRLRDDLSGGTSNYSLTQYSRVLQAYVYVCYAFP